MASIAFWKALYTSGRDAAALAETPDGYRLEGSAIYLLDGEPASIRYALDIAPDWSATTGTIDGFVGARPISVHIERHGQRWTLNGMAQPAVDGLVDLDFGFTPATNYPQLRRMALDVGQTGRITVAWIDVNEATLTPLPQIYRRTAADAYDYDSPQGPYRATLRLAANGFVSLYPDLWEMEAGLPL